MKTLIVSLIAVFFAQAAHAQCCEQKPACPKVRTKVVTKVVEKIVEKPIIVEQERVQVVKQAVPVVVTKTVTVYKKVQKKNRVNLLGGSGPTKVVVTPSDVRLERGAVVGAQYQRMVGESLSIGVQVQSNETVLGSIGLDF